MNMGAAGKVALVSFLKYLPPDSALNRAMNPKDEFGVWYTAVQTNKILADLYDVVVAVNTKKGRKPKEYPRPKRKKNIGSGPIKVKDFWTWWNKER